MEGPYFVQEESCITESIAQQVHEFHQDLDAMTRICRKAIILHAVEGIKQEMQEINEPERPKLLNARHIYEGLIRLFRWTARRLSREEADGFEETTIVLDYPLHGQAEKHKEA